MKIEIVKSAFLILFLFFAKSNIAQTSKYFKLKVNPSFGWTNDVNSLIQVDKPIELSFGLKTTRNVRIETGLAYNKTGYRSERIAEFIGVFDGINSYSLSGMIPVKQNITEKFIAIPLQIAYFLEIGDDFELIFYSSLALNFYIGDKQVNWYFYEMDEEFKTKNHFLFSGPKRFVGGYDIGIEMEKKVINRISISVGVNYKSLFQEFVFPLTPEKIRYHNLGVTISLIRKLNEKN